MKDRVDTERPQAPWLRVGPAWETLLEDDARDRLERDCLPPFLLRQRWFGGKSRVIRAARFVDWVVLQPGHEPAFFTLVNVDFADAGTDTYFVPLAMIAGTEAERVSLEAPGAILARVTGGREGVLCDASLSAAAGAAMLQAVESHRELASKRGTLRAFATSAFAESLAGTATRALAPTRGGADQSNTSVLYGDRLILKFFRRLEPGPNPDFEIGVHLTERVRFPRVPPVAGGIQYERAGVAATMLAVVQGLVKSQANGWDHALAEVGRYYARVAGQSAPEEMVAALDRPLLELADAPVPRPVADLIGGYFESTSTLGIRTAELHTALAADQRDPAFAPEPITTSDLAALSDAMVQHAHRALAALEGSGRLSPDLAGVAALVLAARDRLVDQLRARTSHAPTSARIRIHGDYHLGQVLWAENDYVILDFEGEPARPLAERRAKQSALKDVAGMLRSFGYAAYTGLFAAAAHRREDLGRLEPWARIWQTWTSAAFLRAYRATAGDATFVPADRAELEELLDAFMIEKALYELGYELNHRPEWTRIPLRGILSLLAKHR